MKTARARERQREGERTLPQPKVIYICLGIAVGCLFSNVWNFSNTGNLFHELVVISDAPVVDDRKGSNSVSSSSNHGDNNDVEERKKRFWKYSQTYRYIAPASRYDYIPVPAKECGAGPDYEGWWNLGYNDRSRLGEDKFIYETFFKNKTLEEGFTGTYVELGAFDGRQESNTRFFDMCLGWKGLLIEGNPENYAKTISNRPHAHKMSLAPSCSAEYEAVNKTIQFYRYPMTNVGLVGHAKTYEDKPTVDVPCGPLSPIFEDMFVDNTNNGSGSGLPTLDFFSLDVEGAEMLVLSTINFQAVRINVLMIEIENNHCQSEQCQVRMDVRAKMAAEGYKRYKKLVHASDIYVHPESPFQVPESIAIPN